MLDFDICVVGAGPAGSATAYLLARAGYRVGLFDRAGFPRDKTCGDGITPRGSRVLQRLGAYDAIRSKAFACDGVIIRSDDSVTYSIPFKKDASGPSELLVLPRLELDYMLLQHAISAGPTYFGKTKIVDVRERSGAVRDGRSGMCEVQTDDARVYTCDIAVLATGAESQLLRGIGLLKDKPPLEHAARAYFENVSGLTNEIVLFFDGIDLPGYGWIFPTGPTSANIGCGVFKRDSMPQAERLKVLLAYHPLLQKMLANARLASPLKAYPLRTDFKPAYAGAGRMLCVGEAAGLVNPVTGEGIDYALEAAEFLVAAIGQFWPGAAGIPDPRKINRIAESYRARLAKRFEKRFMLYRFVQKHALNEKRSKRFLEKVRDTPAMQRIVVDGLFGRAKPADFFKPDVLFHAARMMLTR